MPSRELGFPVFDADNHFYETREALTRYLPDRYAGAIEYVASAHAPATAPFCRPQYLGPQVERNARPKHRR